MPEYEKIIAELEKRFNLQIEELRDRVKAHETKIDYLVKRVEQLLATQSDRRDSQRIILLILLSLLSIVFQIAMAVVNRH